MFLPHLYPGLVQLGDPGQLLPVVDVRVLVLSEGDLQLLQLFVGEGGAVAPPGRGGVGPPLPAHADRHRGGLAGGALPRRLPYVCVEREDAFIGEILFPPAQKKLNVWRSFRGISPTTA